MNNSCNIEELFSGYFEQEFDVDNFDISLLSVNHTRKMKRIFRLFDKNSYNNREFVLNRKTITVIVLIILLSVAACGAVVYFVTGNFRGVVHQGYTELSVINNLGGKKNIEYEYFISDVPDGFELIEYDYTNADVFTAYLNPDSVQTIVLRQYVKEQFHPNIDNESSDLREIKINKCDGLYYYANENDNEITIIMWDNGDYILEVTCNDSLEFTLDIAENLKSRLLARDNYIKP